MYLKMEQAQIDELNNMLKINDDAHKMGVLDHQKAYMGLVNLLNKSFSVVEDKEPEGKDAEMDVVASKKPKRRVVEEVSPEKTSEV